MEKKRTVVLSREERRSILLIKQQMRKNPSLTYPLHQLAKETGMNRNKLTSGFLFLYGTSITAYLLEQRLFLAKKLLRHTELPVKAVAADCGFKHEKYFFRYFKRHTGLTPTAYRKRKSK